MKQEVPLRKQLEAQLETLEQRLVRLEDHQRNRHDRGPTLDSDDHAIELENEEVVEALIPKTMDEITLLRRALTRLDALLPGESITCDRCDKPIDPRRLALVPETRFCARCA